jgi:predicted TIM-barrel fold metal-dependent hydrolase
MKFIDFDTHYFPENCYTRLPEPFRSLAPQYNWKYYAEKPDWWDRIFNASTKRDEAGVTDKFYQWEAYCDKGFLCDDNGYHDIDTYPGSVSRYLSSVKHGLEKKLCFDKIHGGPFRGDLRYSELGARDLGERKKIYNQLGIDKGIILPYNFMLGLNYRINYELAVALATAYNNRVQEDCLNQNTFWPVVWLPAQNPNIKENLDMIEQGLSNNAVGIQLGENFSYSSHCLGQAWGTCSWMEPIWAHANEHQYPIFIHVNDCWYDNHKNLNNVDQITLSKWQETHKNLLPLLSSLSRRDLSFASFITEGVLDRYPNLKLNWGEQGIDWVMPLIERLSHMLKHDCRLYLKNWTFCVEPEWPNFQQDAKKIGYDHLVFCTDYPHHDPSGRGQDTDVNLILAMDTDEINKEKIANLNATKFLSNTNFF